MECRFILPTTTWSKIPGCRSIGVGSPWCTVTAVCDVLAAVSSNSLHAGLGQGRQFNDCGSVAILCIAQCRTFWLGLHMLGKVSWLTAGKDRLQYTRSLPTNSLMCDSYWNSQITLSHFCNFFLPVAFESGHDILFRITWIRLLVQLHCVVFNRMVPVRLKRWRLLKALSPQRQKQQLSIHRYLTVGIVWSYRVLCQCIRTSASLTASVSVRGVTFLPSSILSARRLTRRSLANFSETFWSGGKGEYQQALGDDNAGLRIFNSIFAVAG